MTFRGSITHLQHSLSTLRAAISDDYARLASGPDGPVPGGLCTAQHHLSFIIHHFSDSILIKSLNTKVVILICIQTPDLKFHISINQPGTVHFVRGDAPPDIVTLCIIHGLSLIHISEP